MSIQAWSRGVLLALLTAAASSCEKEEKVTGPVLGNRPDDVLVTATKPAILSDGRDSTALNIQLLLTGSSFQDVYRVNMLTDEFGYFREAGVRKSQIAFLSDKSGRASVYLYGSGNPGMSLIRTWGEGFGVDTVKVAVILGIPYFLKLEFRDFLEQRWALTDTLKAGVHFARPDSTLVRVTVLDRDFNPLEGIVVNLIPLINGGPIRFALYGYFKTSKNPNQNSNGTGLSGTDGTFEDTYYSDDLPNFGDPVRLEVIARVDSAQYGRIDAHKFITIVP